MIPSGLGVTWRVADGLANVRLEGEHGNAINARLLEGLIGAASEASDQGVRGVLLTARGKLFCPGLDLVELLDHDRAAMRTFMRRFAECLEAWYVVPKPLVAAISGHALAGGCILALLADLRVLRTGALIGLNEVKVGLPLPYGVAIMLRDAVSRGRLEEVALLGRNYADDEAVATGLVHEVHGEEGFEAHCRMRLEELAWRDPLAFGTTKRYLRSAVAQRMHEQSAELIEEFLDCWFSTATRRRVQEIVSGLRNREKR